MRSVCIGVDVGGTNLRLALVDREGGVVGRLHECTDVDSGVASFLTRLQAAVERLKREAEVMGRRVTAVGIGLPGLISNDGVVRSCVNFSALDGVNLSRVVSEGVALPVLALNDANACAIGEQRFGAGRGFRSSLTLTIGTGIGAGLILDGRLWTGADGVAGEFGHITVEPDGRPCGCGNRGCVEQYASASALSPQRGGAAAVALRARAGDRDAAALFEKAGSYLGIAAAGVLNLLNLEAIILGGGVAESFDLLAAPMRREILARSFAIPGARAKILKGALGDDAGVLGAAALAFDAPPPHY
ncbi:MAG TPA: ROK family protein [Geobacter sp.]|nr:ROK family protein [Geobacter sp.]